MNVELAELLALRAHRGQLEPTGAPLIAHVRRVVAATPEFARPVAWLHEILEWTSISEEELLADGVLDEELRALRLLARPLGRGSDASYLAHIRMLARADGPAGTLARTVKLADLRDRVRHPCVRPDGSHPPYGQALRELADCEAAARLPSPGIGQLRFDRSMDIAVDVVGADPVDDSVGL